MGELPEAEIFDLDGSLVDVSGIRHLLEGPGRYDAFHRASIDCPPNAWVVDAARIAHRIGRAVLIVTGRSVEYRNLTAMWLALQRVPSEAMWMRGRGDYRKDYVVKREILAKIRTRWNPVAAWDDNPAVLQLWREEGIRTVRVPGWDDELALYRPAALGRLRVRDRGHPPGETAAEDDRVGS